MEQSSRVKPAVFHPQARAAIRRFPDAARLGLGQAVWDLQRGVRLGMPLSRPMPTVAPGVEELRIRDVGGAFRVFYYLRSVRGVLVFHAFEKKTQKTPQREIATGQRRLKEMLDEIG